MTSIVDEFRDFSNMQPGVQDNQKTTKSIWIEMNEIPFKGPDDKLFELIVKIKELVRNLLTIKNKDSLFFLLDQSRRCLKDLNDIYCFDEEFYLKQAYRIKEKEIFIKTYPLVHQSLLPKALGYIKSFEDFIFLFKEDEVKIEEFKIRLRFLCLNHKEFSNVFSKAVIDHKIK
jgi:hypothetical protein